MLPDFLKHLGRVLRTMFVPDDEPMQCPRCHRPQALLLAPPANATKPVQWQCRFCNQIVPV